MVLLDLFLTTGFCGAHSLLVVHYYLFKKKKKIQNIFRFRNFGWSTLLLFGLTAYSEIYFSVLVIGCISCHTNNKRYTLELCVRNDFFLVFK